MEIIKFASSAQLTTSYGEFIIKVYADLANSYKEHVALIANNTNFKKAVNVRVHSSCLTGDVFSSLRCDCRQQLEYSLQLIAKEGGVIVYLDQEGRDIGIANKIKAYKLQEEGLDTVDANVHLGLPIDERSFDIAAAILLNLQINAINLLTNNPKKIKVLENWGIKVARQVIPVCQHPLTQGYLKTKKEKMHHLL
jgi:GTP cyclohydrolase II